MDPSPLRDERTVRSLVSEISAFLARLGRETKLMEVCGTHTMTAYRSGLGRLLRRRGLRLISGPGCPVCVTPDGILSAAAILVARTRNLLLASFGDMLKVPTSAGSLLEVVPAEGSRVTSVYSPQEVIGLARTNPGKEVVFLAAGFETTSPSIAWVAREARRQELKNLSFLVSLRVVPPPLRAILSTNAHGLDGFIYPGHVSVIIGSEAYRFIPEEFGLPGAISGFEPADLLLGIISVLRQIENGDPKVDIAYPRAVKPEGNRIALGLVEEVFEVADAEWRGFGTIPKSGLRLRDGALDAACRFGLELTSSWENEGCRCGEILRGAAEPEDCPLFMTACNPDTPLGPCMVSVEGSCLIHCKYGAVEWIE